MTDAPDPIARPGNDDPGIEHATDEVVKTWDTSASGKEADADATDFERMREGFADLADGSPVESTPPGDLPDVRGRHA